MPATSTDRIEKQIVLDAPRSRVWRALTDVRQFNQWFGVNLEQPFKAGEKTSGRITIRGYDHIVMEAWVETIEPEHHFSFRWHPGSVEPNIDYSAEPTTLVVFTLEDDDEGTKLTVVETGFDALPESRRAKAFSGNESGWTGQLRNIAKYVKANP
jgi:uncharacterized protein YndB with AHSA1/START domain